MANTQTVGFFGPNNPSIAAQQRQTEISKALADALTKAGSEQSQTEFAGGLAVPQSSAVGAGKMAQMLAGAYINKQNTDAANKLSVDSYNQMAGMYGAPQYPSASAPENHGTMLSRLLGMNDGPATTTEGIPVGQAVDTPTQPSQGAKFADALGGAPTPQPETPFKLNGFSGADSMILSQTSPDAYAKILENQHHLTDKMLENQQMGITPPQAKTMALAPLSGQLGPNGNLTLDAQGNPSIAPVPGAAAVIQQNKRAEAAGTPTKQTMTMPDGSVRTDVPVFGNGEVMQPIDPSQPVPAQYKPSAPVMASGAPPASSSQMLADMNGGKPASFGADPAKMKSAETGAGVDATNIAEIKKQYEAAISNGPSTYGNFQSIREAAPDASYGMTSVLTKPIHQLRGDATADANTIIKQKGSQNILKEMGPILAGTGAKPNRFFEKLSADASSLDENDNPKQKKTAVNGLDDNYTNGTKALAKQLRDAGMPAMSDEEIDAWAAKNRVARDLSKNPATPTAAAPGKLIGTSGGKKVYELPNGSHVMEQ